MGFSGITRSSYMDYKWVVLTVTTVGIFMATLDASILIVGLPTVISDLNTNIVVGIWIITIYRLAITVLLVTIGRVADLFGRVRLYTWGFAVFTVGSLLSGLSPTAEFLLAFRLIQGTGAALLFVNGVAIVTDAFAGTGQLGKGIGLNQVAINLGTKETPRNIRPCDQRAFRHSWSGYILGRHYESPPWIDYRWARLAIYNLVSLD